MTPNDIFIGAGTNPNPKVPDIPLGLGMKLSQSPNALNVFGNLSDTDKTRLIGHIQSSRTGEEAKRRIVESVTSLSNGNTNFF